MNKWIELESSAIRACYYESDSNHLLVHFNNKGMYIYSDVPAEVYEEFIKAESAGKFFNQKIKDKFTVSEL